jgi:hypothetical protein
VKSGKWRIDDLTPSSLTPDPSSVIPTPHPHSALQLTALKLKDIDAIDEFADRKVVKVEE